MTLRPSEVPSCVTRYGGRAVRIAVACLLLSAAEPCERPAAAAGIPPLFVDVEDPAGLARRAWPVSAGVPFPQGALSDVSRLRLRSDPKTSKTENLQGRVLSRWPDGSIRWASLDWQVSLSAGERHRYEIDIADPATVSEPIAVTETADNVAVDTGALRFSIPKTHFSIAENVHLRGNPVQPAGIGAFMSIEAQHRAAAAPTSVEIVENGPLRVRIAVRGSYGGEFQYVTRIDAFAGQSFIRVLHSFENRSARPLTSVRQMAIDIPLALASESATYRFGREKEEPLAGSLTETPVVILQEDNVKLLANATVQTGRSRGWIEARDATRGVVIASRFLWQEYPQSVHLTASRVRLNLWAPEVLPAAVGTGAAKTHELAFAFFGDTPPSHEELAGIVDPLVGHVNPAWVVSTKALPNSLDATDANVAFLDEVRAGFQRYRETADQETWDDRGELDCADPTGERQRRGYYGMLNWGDWNFPWYRDMVNGCETWGNLEYDTTQAFALAYAATGDRDFHTAMTTAARHFMDVDRIHAAPASCDCAGMTHPRVARHFNFDLGEPDLGYAWTEGLVSYFYLTGDERALEAVRGIADYLVRRTPPEGAVLAPRQWGWPQIALISAYEATGSVRYKKAARTYARRSMAAHPAERGYDLGAGTLADALAYVHAHMPDRGVRAWLVANAAAVMSAPPGADPRYFPAVAYVGRLSQNEAYQRAAVKSLELQRFGNWGKSFTLSTRTGFRILSMQE